MAVACGGEPWVCLAGDYNVFFRRTNAALDHSAAAVPPSHSNKPFGFALSSAAQTLHTGALERQDHTRLGRAGVMV